MKGSPWLSVAVGICLLSSCDRERAKTGDAPSSREAKAKSEIAQVILPPDSPKLKRIRVEAVHLAEVPLNEVEAPGKIEINPNRLSHVLMPVPGRIRRVLVRLGDAVKEGAPLLGVESPEAGSATSAYRQAEAAVSRAQAVLVKAETDLSRLRDLYENRAVAKKEVLSAESLLAQAKADVDQAQASKSEAQRRLEILDLKLGEFGQEVIVRAPIAGKILEITVAPGEYRNDTSSTLMTIADLRTVWVVADIPESSIRLVTLGERIDIELVAYPGETFKARVTQIADVVDAQTRTVRVRAEMSNPSGRFRPEMFGRIRHRENLKQVPVVPVGAVIQGGGHSLVYREKSPGAFEGVDVEAASRYGDFIPVLKGLKNGDRVVIDGAMLLKAP
jgi:cobalt-zinc-cadmium efflux system membrane fusion protein